MTETSILGRSINDLYRSIGHSLVEGRKFASPPNDATLIRRAKLWLSEHRNDLKMAICQSATVHALLRRNSTEREVVLLTAIADLITSLVAPISPWTVAALLIKEGLHRLCPELSDSND